MPKKKTTTSSVADEQFPGPHSPDCTCSACRGQRKRLAQAEKEKVLAQKKDVRKKRASAVFAMFGAKASEAWSTVIGLGTAVMSVYTLLAAVALVAVLVLSLWRALQTDGQQWIVSLCCVPALVVVIWLNERLGAE